MSRPRMITLPGVAPPADGVEVLALIEAAPLPTAQALAELEAQVERRALANRWIDRALARILARGVS